MEREGVGRGREDIQSKMKEIKEQRFTKTGKERYIYSLYGIYRTRQIMDYGVRESA